MSSHGSHHAAPVAVVALLLLLWQRCDWLRWPAFLALCYALGVLLAYSTRSHS